MTVPFSQFPPLLASEVTAKSGIRIPMDHMEGTPASKYMLGDQFEELFSGVTFPTLADLTAATISAGVNLVKVLGHTAEDDGHTQVYKRGGTGVGLGETTSNGAAVNWQATGELDPRHHAVTAPGDKTQLEAYYARAADKPLNPRDFPWNLVMNYPTSGDEGAALQQFLDDIVDIGHHEVEIYGYIGTSTGLIFDGGGFEIYEPQPTRFSGRLVVQATGVIAGPVVIVQGFHHGDFSTDLFVFGTGGATYATRTCREGIVLRGTNARGYFGGNIYAQNFLARGITIESDTAVPPDASNSNSATFRSLTANHCGSGPSTPVTDTFTWVSDNGSDGSSAQRSVITLGSAPDVDLNFVIINGKAYWVDWLDAATTGNNIAVENWIYVADRTAGTLTLGIGYGVKFYGADVNNIVVENILGGNTAMGVWCAGLKWPVVHNLHSEPSHIAVVLGDRTTAAGEGAQINAYSEGSDLHALIVTNVSQANTYIRFMVDDPDLINKVQKIGPLFGGTDYAAFQKLDGYIFDFAGDRLSTQANNSEMINESTPTIETGPKSTRTLNQDTATITLKYREGRGKLFGYADITIICRGTGTYKEPGGTYTLLPFGSETITMPGESPAASVALTFTRPDILHCTYIHADATWKVSRQQQLIRTATTSDPTTSELPVSGDVGIHKNTSSGDVFLAYNDGGAIKKVQLT